MKTIDALTTEQERSLVAYREEWLAHGRSCAPADRPETERVLLAMYAAIGEQEPVVWWCDGPATGSLIRTLLRDNLGANLRANLGDNLGANLGANLRANLRDNLGANLWDNLGANLRDNLGANLWANLRANLGDNLGANLRANLWANLGDNLWDNLGANLRANLRDNLGANLGDNLGDNLRANLRDNLGANLWANLGDNLGANLRANLWANLRANVSWWFWGQHEAAWPAYYAWPDIALRSMHTQEQKTHLGWWLTLARSCGWWTPFKGVAFVCERPLRQAVDDRGRLHHPSLPALECRDGWPVYAWHGVRVSEQIIKRPDTITPAHIQAEENTEVRRVMIERMGWDRWLHLSGATPIQSDRFGDLYRTELDGARVGVVVVNNSTPEPDGSVRKYALLVPAGHDTAHAAIASTFGLTAKTYQPAVES